jgi:hypothetical protein
MSPVLFFLFFALFYNNRVFCFIPFACNALQKPGKYEFLVRWKGYEEGDDTWEPENNLSCEEKLKEYKRM